MAKAAQKRANGEASRERILDAAAAIAGERGYDGTAINLVCEVSGLPASSVYWHFKNKDELIAAVIDRSFNWWMDALQRFSNAEVVAGATRDEVLRHSLRRNGAAIETFPDYLRLGLMLILQRRPEELTARRRFCEIRKAVRARTVDLYRTLFPSLASDDLDDLTTLTFAMADGLFIARESDGADLAEAFDLLATAILATARHLESCSESGAMKAPADR